MVSGIASFCQVASCWVFVVVVEALEEVLSWFVRYGMPAKSQVLLVLQAAAMALDGIGSKSSKATNWSFSCFPDQ